MIALLTAVNAASSEEPTLPFSFVAQFLRRVRLALQLSPLLVCTREERSFAKDCVFRNLSSAVPPFHRTLHQGRSGAWSKHVSMRRILAEVKLALPLRHARHASHVSARKAGSYKGVSVQNPCLFRGPGGLGGSM